MGLELAENKSLLAYINSKQRFITEKWARFWFRHLLAGLIHMHNRGYSHLDVKCENILLDHNLIAKIGDFGHSDFSTENIMDIRCSNLHRAPEIEECKDTPYRGEKADVFALGVVLFTIVFK